MKLEVIVDFVDGRLGHAYLGSKLPSGQKRWKAYPWKTSLNPHKRCGRTCPEELWGLWLILWEVGLVMHIWCQNHQVNKVGGKLTHGKPA
jgi:hypothetical protein